MNAISAIPVFGLTATAADYKVADNTGAQAMTWQWIKRHNSIRKIEKKASSQELGKYMLQVKREDKEEVRDFLDGLFSQIPELEGQPANFHRPQRGSNACPMLRGATGFRLEDFLFALTLTLFDCRGGSKENYRFFL
jgi:hypothetical protein